MFIAKRHVSPWFALLVGILLAAIVGAFYYLIHQGGGSLPVEGQTTNFAATDVTGRTVSFVGESNRVRLITFFYTHCPDECPLTAFRMEEIQKQLEQQGLFPNKVAFFSITLDPTRDTLPVIQKWSQRYDVNPKGWYVVRMDKAETDKVMNSFGIQARPSANPEQIEHITKTILVDGSGNIRKTYSSANLNVSEIVKDINGLVSRSDWHLPNI